ncbi:MAG: succinate dehydrogenase assembly factor 2 [Gammaproteobacteria bacterium]
MTAVASPALLPRLRWRCRRGMLELDLLLNDFLDTKFEHLDQRQLELFEILLDYPDQVLLDLLLGKVPASDPALAEFVARMQRPAG